jgi:hypothetical protein
MVKYLMIIIVIGLISCGEDKSGRRVEYKVMRVREVKTNKINWVRLNPVEQGVYRVGDTLLINPTIHVMAPNNFESDYKYISVVMEK